MNRLILVLALVGLGVAHAQQYPTQNCQFRGSFTAAAPGAPYSNNTTNPNCHIFALTWNTTGFTALSLQLEGSDNGSSWTAYSGTAVVTGTNPSTTLSGAVVVNASTKIAFLRVNVTSVAGTGGINYQVFGVAGASASLGSGGGGGSGCAALGGDLSGTCTDAVVVGIQGNSVTGVQGSAGSLAQLATGPTTVGDLLAYDSHSNAVDSGQAKGPGNAYVASASGTSFSVSMATANQGYNPQVTCWSGPVVVNAGVNTVSGAQIVCTPTNDGAGNVGATWTTSGQVQSVSVAGIGATATAASGLTGGCTFLTTAINGPCKVMINAAQLATLSSTVSVPVLPAVAGKSYFIQSIFAHFNFNTTPYIFTGTNWVWALSPPGLNIDGGTTNLPIFYLSDIASVPTTDQDAQGIPGASIGGSGLSPSIMGQALNLYLQTDGTMTGGDGTLDIYLTYLLI